MAFHLASSSFRSRRASQNGSVALEFGIVMVLAVPMLFGVCGLGITLGRSVQAQTVVRDVGHMYGLGVDMSQTDAREIVEKIAEDFNLNSASGNAVLILSQVSKVYSADCTAAQVSPCTNVNQNVLTHRLVIGNPSLRASAFGTPPANFVASNGNIVASNYMRESSLIATGFGSIITQAQGDLAWVVEGFFIQPDLNFFQAGFPQVNQGTYVRNIF